MHERALTMLRLKVSGIYASRIKQMEQPVDNSVSNLNAQVAIHLQVVGKCSNSPLL